MQYTRRIAAPAGLLLAAGLLGGCSFSLGSSSLDTEKVAGQIKTDLTNGVPAGTPVDVKCAEAEIKTGTTSECTATIGTQTLTYSVVQNDDKGNVTYKRSQAIIDLDKAQSTIASQLADKLGGDWTLNCNPVQDARVYVVSVDETFTCNADGTNGDGQQQSGDIVVTVKDVEGNVDWEVAG